ncbi:MAG: glycosyltransferase family 4 protein [Bacteroidales bacterium]|nr:glycosyltransferase family 4 protein [Bacteroidales bacterium]
MVIVVNTRLLLKERLEGIGWFMVETLSRMTRAHPEHRFIFLFDRAYDPQFIFSGNVTPVVLFPPTRHPLLWKVWFDYRVPGILRKYQADLFLSPDGYLSLRTGVPQLPVIHDLNFVHRPADLPGPISRYYNRYFPLFAQKATRIATVSDWSKEDIATSFHIDPRKIDVVYNACSSAFRPLNRKEQQAVRDQYTAGKPYFLFVGALHPRKNIEGLLIAFEEYKSRTSGEEKLLVVGGKMFKTGNIANRLATMKHRDAVVFTGRVGAEELHQIYGAALALTFVPFFEGFGIPVVEAMGAGIPVICSHATSLPEVAGDAALYADPHQPRQIAWAMQKVASAEALRNLMIEKGFRQKEKFSWDRSAELLWASILKATEPQNQEPEPL